MLGAVTGGPRSGILRYEVKLVADADGTPLGDLSAPPADVLIMSSLSMQCGASVTISSRAVSGALVASEWVVRRVGVDCSPPQGGTLRQNGSAATGATACLTSAQTTRAEWLFVEAESEIVEYMVTLSGVSHPYEPCVSRSYAAMPRSCCVTWAGDAF